MPTEYKYRVRTQSGYIVTVTIIANDCSSAKAMLEAQYGPGSVCGCLESKVL